MKKIILLIALINFCYGQNRLLNLQYINQEYDITQLNKNLANEYLEVDLFNTISAGDILIVNHNGSWYKMLFALDKYWDRIVYTQQNTTWIKAYGSSGHGNGQFFLPYDLKVLNDGSIFVADTHNNRVVRLLFDFNSQTVSFDRNISTGGYRPRSIGVGRSGNFGDNLLFIGTLENKLIINLQGMNYRFPNDFGGSHWPNSLFTSGAYNVAVDEPYLFLIDRQGGKVYVLVYNSNVSDKNLLFTQYFTYPLESDTYEIKKFEIHGSFPHSVAYFVDRNSSIKMKILSANNIPMSTPGVEGKPNAQFDNLAALGLEPNYGDVFIGERWSNNTGGYWYALGPEIQVLTHNNLGYDNLNEFTYTLPEITEVTAEIFYPNGNLLERILDEQDLYPGYQFINFDEYYNGSYLPYSTNYKLKITAKSSYPKQGSAANATSISEIYFTGGVKPTQTDIVASANYILVGRTYTVRTNSNSKSYSPEPLYIDNWRIVQYTGYDGDAEITDINENGSPYKAYYRASHARNSKEDNLVDRIAVNTTFGNQSAGEHMVGLTVHENPPSGCPILCFSDKPYVNVLPQSETSISNTTDRIVIPEHLLQDSVLNISFNEFDFDLTRFESINLVVEDIEQGTKICRTGTGMSVSYSTKNQLKIDYLNGKAVASGDTIQEGDTLIVETNENGDEVIGIEGYVPEEPQYPKETYVTIEEEDQGGAKSSNFLDAAYTRIYPYEDIFFLPDSNQTKSNRKFRLIFSQVYVLDSVYVYSTANTKQNFPIQTSIVEPILINKTNKPNPWPIFLEPGKEIKMSFKLPPIPEYYKRHAYIKITGHYEEAGISSLLNSDLLPNKYELFQNFPNPFNPETNIAFALPNPANVKIEIFNILGQKVWDFNKEYKSGGYYSLVWKGINKNNIRLASGLYIFRLIVENNQNSQQFVSQKKLLLLK